MPYDYNDPYYQNWRGFSMPMSFPKFARFMTTKIFGETVVPDTLAGLLCLAEDWVRKQTEGEPSVSYQPNNQRYVEITDKDGLKYGWSETEYHEDGLYSFSCMSEVALNHMEFMLGDEIKELQAKVKAQILAYHVREGLI